jgi:hypothetical protein
MELAVTRHSRPRPPVRLGLALGAGALLVAMGLSQAGGPAQQSESPVSSVSSAQLVGAKPTLPAPSPVPPAYRGYGGVATDHPSAICSERRGITWASLYDDHFIETCDDWVVPYSGYLLNEKQLNRVEVHEGEQVLARLRPTPSSVATYQPVKSHELPSNPHQGSLGPGRYVVLPRPSPTAAGQSASPSPPTRRNERRPYYPA